MRVVYCANCGTSLGIIRKALPKYGKIIELVPTHDCLPEPIPFKWEPNPIPTYTIPKKGDDKFVEKLNELQPPPIFEDDRSLGDRRPAEHVKDCAKSSAPTNLLNMLREEHDD
jgi:hypothetical protein